MRPFPFGGKPLNHSGHGGAPRNAEPDLLFQIDVLDGVDWMAQEIGSKAAELFYRVGGEKLQVRGLSLGRYLCLALSNLLRDRECGGVC